MDGMIKCSALHDDGIKKLANLKTGREKRKLTCNADINLTGRSIQ